MNPLMVMIDNILLEQATISILYHYTDAWSLAKTLSEKRLGLTVATGSDNLSFKNKMYFLSTTRSKIGHYTVVHSGTSGAVLVLNGDWLAERYEIKPVDYWGREFRKINPTGNEMEERLFSDRPYISFPNPVTRFIKEIHMLVELDTDKRYRPYILSVIINSKRLKIPLFIYRDNRAWLLQNKTKTIPIADIIKQLSKYTPRRYGWSVIRRSDFSPYYELYYRPITDREKLSPLAKNRLRAISPWYLKEALTTLVNNIINSRSPNSPYYGNLIKFIQFLKQHKFATLKSFLQYLSDKWHGEK